MADAAGCCMFNGRGSSCQPRSLSIMQPLVSTGSALPGSLQPKNTGSHLLAASYLDHGKDGAPDLLPGALQPPNFAILHGAVQLCAACSSLPGASLGLGCHLM